MRKTILIFCLTLFFCLPVEATPVAISGVGEVELGQDITVTESQNKKGEPVYSFIVKDGAIWHGALLLPLNANSNNPAFNDKTKTDALLNKMIEEKFSKDESFLTSERRTVVLNGKEYTSATLKMAKPTSGIVVNMDMILIPATDGLKIFSYICADSDTQYWRPILQKIAAAIPK
ncbi:MAG: hypothetical protein LLG02_12990 [Pelosinus sp.]|nr:hypothetical protein [Pelosinus sp.]